jgi:hypothetical protein
MGLTQMPIGRFVIAVMYEYHLGCEFVQSWDFTIFKHGVLYASVQTYLFAVTTWKTNDCCISPTVGTVC